MIARFDSAELERLNVEYKNQHEESLRMVERFKEEKRKVFKSRW